MYEAFCRLVYCWLLCWDDTELEECEIQSAECFVTRVMTFGEDMTQSFALPYTKTAFLMLVGEYNASEFMHCGHQCTAMLTECECNHIGDMHALDCLC